jgi:hypothetical protein
MVGGRLGFADDASPMRCFDGQAHRVVPSR